MNQQQLADKQITIIGKNSFLKGQIELTGMVRVACKVEGTLIHTPISREGQNQDLLILERESVFTGNIIAEDIEIYGKLTGDIKSKGRVIIHSGSEVSGTIAAFNLIIYPGASVEIEGHDKPALAAEWLTRQYFNKQQN